MTGEMTGWYSKPDWVILGEVRDDGKIMLIASMGLTRAVLNVERTYSKADLYDYRHLQKPASVIMSCNLTVAMSAFVVVIANTYEEALRDLFTRWSPTGEPQKAIGQGVFAVEGATWPS